MRTNISDNQLHLMLTFGCTSRGHSAALRADIRLLLACHFFVHNTFIIKQKYGNMEYICFTVPFKSVFFYGLLKRLFSSQRKFSDIIFM